jgi:hypothetical protein
VPQRRPCWERPNYPAGHSHPYYLGALPMYILPPLALGIPLVVLGLLGVTNALIQQRRARRLPADKQGTSITRRFNLPILCTMGLALCALGLLFQVFLSPYGLVAVVIFLLASASHNAWTLLVQTGELHHK